MSTVNRRRNRLTNLHFKLSHNKKIRFRTMMKKILWRIKRQNRKAKLLVKNLKSAKLQRKVTKKLKKVNQKVLRERLPKEVKKLQRKAK